MNEGRQTPKSNFHAIDGWPERRIVAATVVAALAIRLYLVLTNFCISADGIEYLEMARDFAAGHWMRALGLALSPLYPWLISLASPFTNNLEMAGNLISALFGTAAVAILYYLMREAFGRRDIATGAAALAAIHPGLASYSASVRTESGYLCLAAATIWLFARGVRKRSISSLAVAGAVGGIAYLYRAEAIGLAVVCCAFLVLRAMLSREWTFKQAIAWSLSFAIPFLIVASPYLTYLHAATGHWIVSSQLNQVAAGGMTKTATGSVDPRAYLYKVGDNLMMSGYYFAQAIEAPVLAILIAGLWIRGRTIAGNWSESLLASFVLFYYLGLAFLNTGPRFMLHIAPFTFGWAIIGFEWLSLETGRIKFRGRPVPRAALAIILALLLLPRTLWPIGYDLRAFRYAAADLRRSTTPPVAIAAGDRRIAWYAGARFIQLPTDPMPDLCGWLATVPAANYLMLASREERRWGASAARCLTLVKRYPRTGSSYFDLFQVTRTY